MIGWVEYCFLLIFVRFVYVVARKEIVFQKLFTSLYWISMSRVRHITREPLPPSVHKLDKRGKYKTQSRDMEEDV